MSGENFWHVCLVSEQPLANLLPALYAEPRPRGVVLCATEPMRARAGWLREVLETRGGLAVRQVSLGGKSDDVAALRRDFERLLDDPAWAANGQRPCLNATGGTKIMALVAVQEFLRRALPVFYLDRDRLAWHDITDITSPRPTQTLVTDGLRIEDVLRVHGWRVVPSTARRPRPNVTRALVQHAEHQPQGFLSSLTMIKRALNTNNGRQAPRPSPNDPVIRTLVSAGLLAVQNGTLQAGSHEAINYITGGWLEDYLLEKARALVGSCLDQAEGGLKVTRDDAKELGPEQSEIEIDLALLKNGRLYLVECKTVGRSARSKVDKLERWKAIGGSSTRVAFVSLREIPEPWIARLRRDSIRCWTLDDLPRIDEKIRDWVSS